MLLANMIKTFAAHYKKIAKLFGSNGPVKHETRQIMPEKEQKQRQHLHELTPYNGFVLPEKDKD